MDLRVSLPFAFPSERRAIVAMLGAMACFSVQDALCRIASQEVPVSQILFVRGLCGAGFLVCLAIYLGVPLRHRSLTDWRVWIRAVIDVLVSASYTYALKHLELANVTAIAMSAPFILTLFAAVFLKEPIGASRWLSVLAGLLGVLLVVQPVGGNFNAWSLLVLLSAALMASRDMLTRVIGGGIPSLLLSMTNVVATATMGGVWGYVEYWPPLHTAQILVLVFASIAMCTGYLLLIMAMRAGAIGVVAPFRYSALLFSAVIGYAVWSYVPNMIAWIGIALIVSSGVLAHLSTAKQSMDTNNL